MQPDSQPRDKCHTGRAESSAPVVTGSAPRNWKLTLAYDGSDFSGWQVQPGLRTVQGELAEAIERITGEIVLPQGSGRTDAGVHALGQAASFALHAPIPAENLLRALRFTLPRDMQPVELQPVGPDFHARHSAVAKTYEYRVFNGASCSPFLSRYVHATSYVLDFGAMQAAARGVEGEHDFTSFAASDPDRAAREFAFAEASGRDNGTLPSSTPRGGTPPLSFRSAAEEPAFALSSSPGNQPTANAVRRIYSSEWQQRDGLLVYRVTGSGFLHHMVRNLVGTFLEIGRGLRPADAMPEILAARSRGAAGATAPASGLFLVSVQYPEAL